MVDQQGNASRALLPRWANSQDSWCRAIVAETIKTGVEASNTDIDRYLALLLAEKKLSDEPFQPVAQIEEIDFGGNPLDPVRLDSIKLGDGVNALKSGTQIDFAPRVTVIFGENGSGKSGFVRVLKRAAGVRTAEDILHNVRDNRRSIPSAIFAVTIATSQTIKWNNEFGVAPLNRVSVFDAKGSRLHVEDDLTYVYTPGELNLFPLVQSAVERVRAVLESKIANRTPGSNNILSSFDRSCPIYSSIETLGAATDLDEIKKYSELPENIDATIDSLRIEIDALASVNIQGELRRSRDRAALVKTLKTAIATAKAFDITVHHSFVKQYTEALIRRDEAGGKAFHGLGVPGVLTREWQEFIQAGEEYLRKNSPETYPKAGDTCAYCRQELTDTAIRLVTKYRDFCNNQIKAALDTAKTQLGSYVKNLLDLNVEGLQAGLTAEIAGGPDILERLIPVVERIKKLRIDVASDTEPDWADKNASLVEAETVVSGEEARLADLVANLQTSIDQRKEALKTKQSELDGLRARKTTKTLLPQIEKRVSDAKWVGRAAIVKTTLTLVLRSLTASAKEASEELLNKDFGRRFEEECRRLRAPKVTLNFPGRQGQVARRKLVGSYKPTAILSEGEQKALALADFLAEVTSMPAASPVVFDDPITSMDYRRIHEVCDRIVALSSDHQIIVFTHNIWFAAKLLAEANKKDWKYYDIRLEGDDIGVVTAASHPRVDNVTQVSDRIRKIIETAGKQTGEVRAALVEKGYEDLRALCETIVEQEMFKGVIQRYTPNVMMTKLVQVNVAQFQDSVTSIMPIFEKSCRYIASHSQPLETQGIRPTLDELKADHEAVLKARQPHKG